MEPLVVAGAIVGGAALTGAVLFAAWRYARPAKPEQVEMEIVRDHDDHATFIPPAPRAQPASPPSPVATAPPPPAASPRSHPERAPAMLLTHGVTMQDDAFSRRAPARPAPTPSPAPPRRAPPMKSWAQEVKDTMQPEVPTEWARRQVGPVEPGRVAGACGGCGARLSVTDARPLRIACPVCGRTKLIA